MVDAITSAVLRGADARTLNAARFDVDLRTGVPVPEHLVAEARAAAHAAGFAAGWAQGQQQSQQDIADLYACVADEAQANAAAVADAAARALAALDTAARYLERQTAATGAELEELLLTTAVDIAEALVGRELTRAADPGRDALRRALALAPANRPVTVRLNPADHATLTADGQNRFDLDGRAVTLLADATLGSGDAIAECDATSVDARITTALERIRAVLS